MLTWLLETRAGRAVVAGGAVCLLLSPAWIAVKQALRGVGAGVGRRGGAGGSEGEGGGGEVHRQAGRRDMRRGEEGGEGEGEEERLLGVADHSTGESRREGKQKSGVGGSTEEHRRIHGSSPSSSPSPTPSLSPFSASPLRKRQQSSGSRLNNATSSGGADSAAAVPMAAATDSDGVAGEGDGSSARGAVSAKESADEDERGRGDEMGEGAEKDERARGDEQERLLQGDVESQLGRSRVHHLKRMSPSKQSATSTSSFVNSARTSVAPPSSTPSPPTSSGQKLASGMPATCPTPSHSPSPPPPSHFPSLGSDHSLWQAVRTPCFWLIYAAMTLASGSGLTTINNLGQMARSLGYQQEQVGR